MPQDRRADPAARDDYDGPTRPIDRVRSWLGLRGGLVSWIVLLVTVALPGAAAGSPAMTVTEPTAMVAALLGYAGIMYLFMRLITHA